MLDFLVLRGDQEACSIGTNVLVVLERRLDWVAALGIGALADERGFLQADLLGRVCDPLVGVAERGLRLGNS